MAILRPSLRPLTLRVVLLAAVSGGCKKPASTDAAVVRVAPAVIPAAAVPVDAPRAVAPPEVARAELNDRSCALRMTSGAVASDCPRDVLACAEFARAEIAPPAGDEILTRCTAPDAGRAFLVVSTASVVLWAGRIDAPPEESEDCEALPDLRMELVDAVDDAPRELMLHATGCYAPGSGVDWDVLWKWQDNALLSIARSEVTCTSLGNTGDPSAPPPPRNARYRCSGGYLDVGGAAQGWTLSSEQVQERTVSGEHARNGRMSFGTNAQHLTMRWSPTAFRFVF